MSSGRSDELRSRNDRSQQPMANSESAAPGAMPQGDSAPSELGADDVTCSMPLNSQHVNEAIAFSVSKFQQELDQKDELIKALIQELEKAVEQLDRFQRTGPDHSHNGQSSVRFKPVHPSMDSQSPLMDDLRQMAEDWEQSRPGESLGRIESQLATLHELVLGLRTVERQSPAIDDFQSRLQRYSQPPEDDKEEEPANQTLDESSVSWNEIKQQMLGSLPVATENDSIEADAELLRMLAETPTPTPVDLDNADLQSLKQAVIDRDAYIVQVNRLFRTRNVLSLPVDWAELANVPSEMQLRVESLIEQLDVQVRLGEVEMSLERARIARERSQIQNERDQIEKQMRRLGVTSLADLNNISAATGSATDRRWMRFLGPNTK